MHWTEPMDSYQLHLVIRNARERVYGAHHEDHANPELWAKAGCPDCRWQMRLRLIPNVADYIKGGG